MTQRESHTLQPTALVNEAYLHLVDQQRDRWQSRTHFFAIVSHLMRRILVDHARSRQAEKRQAQAVAASLDEAGGVDGARVAILLFLRASLATRRPS